MNNLLITIGDSWTEGRGCYPDYILEKYGDPPVINYKDPACFDDYNLMCKHFKENGWPARLAALLENYEMINLGKAGAANSACAKNFETFLRNFNRQQYDRILVIFLMSEPSRFSFFSNREVKSFLPSWNEDSLEQEKFMTYYTLKVAKSDDDFWNESIFYLNCISSFCKNFDMDLVFGSAFSRAKDCEYFKNMTNILFRDQNNWNARDLLDDAEMSKCHHPNIVGYKKIAEYMYADLKKLDFIKR
jgi:hypothetical protein